MLPLRHRLVIAGVVTAAAIAIPAAALASGPGSPAGKAASTQAPAPSASKSAPSQQDPSAAMASKSAAAQAVPQPRVYGPAAVNALAARLHVGAGAAGRAYKEVSRLLAQTGRVDTASPAFAAIARGIGVSPAQLAAAWDAVEHDGANG
jgi:hypothetical protein